MAENINPEANADVTTGVGDANTPTMDELLAELAAERAQNEKNKASIDKLSKENGNLTKSLRAKQTAEEQEAAAKQEQEEQQAAYVAELEEFKRTTEAKERYALQGMDPEMAAKAAKAEIEGDMDTLSAIQKQHTDNVVKQAKADFLKERPQPSAGSEYASMTRDEIMAIKDPAKRREAIRQNLDIWTKN